MVPVGAGDVVGEGDTGAAVAVGAAWVGDADGVGEAVGVAVGVVDGLADGETIGLGDAAVGAGTLLAGTCPHAMTNVASNAMATRNVGCFMTPTSRGGDGGASWP
jgi:hypothetical protein